MGSRYPPGFYDEHALRMIEDVFHQICEQLARISLSEGCDNDALKVALVQQLLKSVEEGITDPTELQRVTLSRFTDPASI